MAAYPEIGNAKFWCALWIFKEKLALKIRVRCEIAVVLL